LTNHHQVDAAAPAFGPAGSASVRDGQARSSLAGVNARPDRLVDPHSRHRGGARPRTLCSARTESYRLAKVQLRRPAHAAIEATAGATRPSSPAGPPRTPGGGSRPRSRRWPGASRTAPQAGQSVDGQNLEIGHQPPHCQGAGRGPRMSAIVRFRRSKANPVVREPLRTTVNAVVWPPSWHHAGAA
jgi:hypothetical protein